jgi:hypothetical protein
MAMWLSCFHFMYYDVLLAVMPIYLLLADLWKGQGIIPRRGAVPLLFLALLFVVPHAAEGVDYLVNNGKPIFHMPPFDTFFLLALWAWCGWQWVRNPPSPMFREESAASPPAGIRTGADGLRLDHG